MVQNLQAVPLADRTAGMVQRPDPMATVGSIPCTSSVFAELSAEILRGGKELRFQARGTSMSPLVRDGDVLLVQPADPNAVRVGDVVLCHIEEGRVVVHRVIREQVSQEGHWFTVQGDAAAQPDGLLPGGQVYGRVTAIKRGAGNIDLERPVMKMLGGLAALSSRWGLGRGPWFRLATRVVKRLPVFSRHLA